MTKLTYAKALEMVMAIEEVKANEELVKKIGDLKTSIEKKSTTKSGEKKETPQQKENAKIKGVILDVMGAEPNRLFTITELVKGIGTDFGELSNQRVSQIVRQMYLTDGTVERIEDKRKAFFKIIVE